MKKSCLFKDALAGKFLGMEAGEPPALATANCENGPRFAAHQGLNYTLALRIILV